MTTDALDLLAFQTLARTDFYWFSRYMFYKRRNYKWMQNWHHEKICQVLQDVYDGKENRVVINIPPRYSKTELVIVNFIAWCMGKTPDSEFIYTSYSADLAHNYNAQARDLIKTEAYQELFPDTKVSNDKDAKGHWGTTKGGVSYSAGVGGTMTGYGAGKMRETFGGAILVDDPHKASEARSKKRRQNVQEWFAETLKSRLNDPIRTPMIIIMQRLHEDDLTGWLMTGNDDDDWTLLKMPALQPDGTALWPKKHDVTKLKAMQEAQPYMFAGQYQQEPTPGEGGEFKVSMIEIVDALPATANKSARGWDLASTSNEGDYTAGVKIWQGGDGYFYVEDVERGQWDSSIVRSTIKLTAQLDGKLTAIRLPQDPGQAGKDQAKSYTRLLAGYNVAVLPVSGDKITRAEPFAAQVNAGNVRLIRGDWNKAYIDELKLFPLGTNDDQVDGSADAFNHLFNFENQDDEPPAPIPTVKNYW
ncbi:phage terminase large subunit [Psychrobacter sp.]|uniref:phage terminase large subunit n=1 Tax=Psychrobacter sp. TaxID=56811 RepID=UPI00356398FE